MFGKKKRPENYGAVTLSNPQELMGDYVTGVRKIRENRYEYNFDDKYHVAGEIDFGFEELNDYFSDKDLVGMGKELLAPIKLENYTYKLDFKPINNIGLDYLEFGRCSVLDDRGDVVAQSLITMNPDEVKWYDTDMKLTTFRKRTTNIEMAFLYEFGVV